LYPAQRLRWEAAKQGPAIRGLPADCVKSFVSCGYDLYRFETGAVQRRIPETFAVQLCKLCISPFIRGKYDFTSQFI
jgi:hypothetical protein